MPASIRAPSNRRRGSRVDGNWLINWRLYLILIDDNGDNAGRICKRSEIPSPKRYWLHLAFSDSMMTADINCNKREREKHKGIHRDQAVSDIQQDCPLVLCIWALHTQTSTWFAEDLQRCSRDLHLVFDFWQIRMSHPPLVSCCVVVHQLIAISSRHLKSPKSNFIKWQTTDSLWVWKCLQSQMNFQGTTGLL